MDIEDRNQFIRIGNTLIRISKIDSVKTRHVVKANNFGKVSDETYPEIMVSVGAEKYIFTYQTEAEQTSAFEQIEQIISK